MKILNRSLPFAVGLILAAPQVLLAGPDMECSQDNGSQVEIADCVAKVEAAVDGALASALQFATASAEELDKVTERTIAVPALEAGQAAWSAYRDAHCEYVGSTYGGGSGTSIAIRSCRIELGRDRVKTLLSFAR